MEGFSSGRTRKSWRIKNDDIKFFTFTRKPRQYRHCIVGDEAMSHCGQAVQHKILASAFQGSFGKIDIKSHCSDIGCADREGAGVGKAVQQALGCDVTNKASVFSLIWKQTHRKACPEIDPKFQMPLGSNRLKVFGWVATY